MSTVFVTELVVLSRLSGRCFRFLQLLSTEFMANPPRPQWGLQYHLCHRNSTNLSLLSEALSLFLPGAALNIALTTQRALSQYFGTSTWIPVFSVCCCCYSVVSCVWLFTTPWTAACQASLSFIISWSLLNSCPLSQECCLTTSSSATLFSFCLQSLLSLRSFMSRPFALGGQSIGASVSVFPLKIQGWFPLGLTDLISLQSKGLSRVFSSTTIQKHQFFSAQPSLWSNSHICTWLMVKP